MKTCAVCGKLLPNRYAVAGVIHEKGQDYYYCSLHWDDVKQKPKKGSLSDCGDIQDDERVASPLENDAPNTETKDDMSDQNVKPKNPLPKLSAEQGKNVVQKSLQLMKKMQMGATDLFKKLTKAKTPQDVLEELDRSLNANTEKREALSSKLESLYREISQKKKAYASAPKARQRVLHIELQTLLKNYKNAERTLTVLLENESRIQTIKSRMEEAAAYELTGVNESMIDKLADDLEEKVVDAELLDDSMRDLEKAGKRRDKDLDTDSLWEELEGFEDEATGSVAESLGDEDFSEDTPDPCSDIQSPEGGDDEDARRKESEI